ncbi:cyanophycinase [Glaciecola sp. KUL10]|uniref:cyanophycinase n=1 Tax=Glaciecola sp. (strain KUL10) TaxID=2161813 RepID=UPI000D78A9AA|nr:cyanophycinase [Glaciecola sp. KUL10]GBL05430.1 hypothetical protein KUL10_27500 [Glaciecola sp. KUL10]
MRNLRLVIVLKMLFFSAWINASDNYDLLLAGGALKGCSSYSVEACKPGIKFESAKTNTLYLFSVDRIDSLQNFISQLGLNEFEGLRELLPVLADFSNQMSFEEPLTRRALFDLFKDIGVEDTIRNLTNQEYYALLDYLEFFQNDGSGGRLREKANFSFTKSEASKDIWEHFSSLTKYKHTLQELSNEKPLVLVVTASSRDNFEAVDFYVSGLRSLGLDARWLPLSAALLKALEQNKVAGSAVKGTVEDACVNLDKYRQEYNQFDRERVYPDLASIQLDFCRNPQSINQLISRASAIFFNGGDQSKTLSAFVSNGSKSEYLVALENKMKKGHILVAGTSAGTAVQSGGVFARYPIAMVSSGNSKSAISRGAFAVEAPPVRCESDACATLLEPGDLTYRQSGGLGLFNKGVLDTHFSERDREARLIVLAQSTNAKYGFGIDETTALLVKSDEKSLHFSVVGQAGVFVADNSASAYQKILANKTVSHSYSGNAHFFPSGTSGTLVFEENQWSLDFARPAYEAPKSKGDWRELSRAICKGANQVSGEFEGVRVLLNKHPTTKTFSGKDQDLCGYLFMQYAITNY